MRYVIIGHSAAGVFAAEAIRERDSNGEIIMLTAEPDAPYCKCLAFQLLEGTTDSKLMEFRPGAWAGQTGVLLSLGTEVKMINGTERQVVLTTGESFQFDRLLIATGARTKPLNLPGGNLPGVLGLRTAEDVRSIRNRSGQTEHAVVFGGGLISLKSAQTLHKLGLEVSIIIPSEEHWSQMLDIESAEMVRERLAKTGIKFYFGQNIREIKGSVDTGVSQVVLTDGIILKAGLVITGTGVQPNCELVNTGEIKCGNGIKVNEFMQTSIPGVYAAGDVVETTDIIYGVEKLNPMWTAATQQGRIAGLNMAGGKASYPGALSMNSVDFGGLSLMSAGVIRSRPGVDCEIHESKRLGCYRKLVFQGERLIGYIQARDIINNEDQFPGGILTNLINRQIPCRTKLLESFPKIHQFAKLFL